jgi:hypothetical protein
MNISEVRDCPHCGAKAENITYDYTTNRVWVVYCNTGGWCQAAFYSPTLKSAIEGWNRRC